MVSIRLSAVVKNILKAENMAPSQLHFHN